MWFDVSSIAPGLTRITEGGWVHAYLVEGQERAALVDSERYLLVCSRYIELNPVRANMVEGPADYKWSSYRHNALGELDDCVRAHPLYEALGADAESRQVAYRRLFRFAVDDALLNELRTTVNQEMVLGSDRFKDQVEKALERRVRPGKPGRPGSDNLVY